MSPLKKALVRKEERCPSHELQITTNEREVYFLALNPSGDHPTHLKMCMLNEYDNCQLLNYPETHKMNCLEPI